MNNRYRIQQIKVDAGATKNDLAKKILKKLGNRDLILTDMEIIRESIDARDKKDIKLVYTCLLYTSSPSSPLIRWRMVSAICLPLPKSRWLAVTSSQDSSMLKGSTMSVYCW